MSARSCISICIVSAVSLQIFLTRVASDGGFFLDLSGTHEVLGYERSAKPEAEPEPLMISEPKVEPEMFRYKRAAYSEAEPKTLKFFEPEANPETLKHIRSVEPYTEPENIRFERSATPETEITKVKI